MKGNEKLYASLWKACNDLRGKFDPSEFKYVILTIIFLKFSSDSYELIKNELEKEDITDVEEQKDMIKSKKILLIPNGCHWNDILKHKKDGNIHNVVDDVLEKYEKNNPKLKNQLWKKFGEKFQDDSERLSSIIDEFSKHDFGKTISECRDFLGRAYEYFLKQFGEDSGKKAGEFYTPKTIVELMVEILIPIKPQKNLFEIYDPTCGSGGMFIQSNKLLQKKHYDDYIRYYGQEINDNTFILAIMNLSIRGLNFDLGDKPTDTLLLDVHKNKTFDVVIANPPFNLKINANTKDRIKDDPRWQYGIPSESKANYYFLQHMIYKMNDNGIMGILLDNGSQTSNATEKIRKKILEDDLYEAVIELPQNIFYGTSIQATLYILNKNKKNKDKVLFIDAKNEYKKDGILNELSSENISHILKIYKDFNKGKDINIKEKAKSVLNKEIIDNYSSLSPRQYIENIEEKIDYEKDFQEATDELKKNILSIKEEFDKVLKALEENKKF